MNDSASLRAQLAAAVSDGGDRHLRAAQAADAIRGFRAYRWVGIYDVGATEIALIAYSGSAAPAYPVFPVSQGLSSEAVRSRTTVLVNDVANDPRYLTAFRSTGSEMIVPVLVKGRVVGTIDVESERLNAFDDNDRAALEACAQAITPLFAF
jgi:L-methionine (R)-S-oxide reductase